MTLILTSELLDNLDLKIMKKNQKDTNNTNYYFTSLIGLNLYNAKVIVSNTKFLVLQFDKIKNYNLLLLLRKTNNFLQNELKKRYSELFNENIYSLVSESDKDDTFSIRCYLPSYKGHYNIKYDLDGIQPFKLPKVNHIINIATVDIRNLWKSNDVLGFNLELKSVKI